MYTILLSALLKEIYGAKRNIPYHCVGVTNTVRIYWNEM
jgi:hypothetical protein